MTTSILQHLKSERIGWLKNKDTGVYFTLLFFLFSLPFFISSYAFKKIGWLTKICKNNTQQKGINRKLNKMNQL